MEKEKMVKAVCRLQKGDEAAAAELYEAFQPDIYFFIMKTVNDRELAEDLTQDSFIEILQTIDKLQEPAAFPGWARQIAYHKCTAYFRKRHELLADENEDGSTVFDTIQEDRAEFIPDEALDKDDLKQTILAMVNDLPEEQRAAIVLRYYNEVSVKEIAQIQGVSENTVKSRLNYGRKTIKQAVESYEKKSGIKLRCVGIVPLLLWMFRQQAVSAGVSITTKTAAAAITTGAASAGGASAATAAASTGAKVAGKFAAKKIIAGVVAAAVVTGGVTAGFLLSKQPEPEEKPMTWYGHETLGIVNMLDIHSAWVDLEIDKMSDSQIEGSMVITRENEVINEVTFEGEGVLQEPEKTDETEEKKPREKDGVVVYTITFDEPIAVKQIVGEVEYTQETLIYDKATDTFTIKNFCYALEEVRMVRTGSEKAKTLAKDAVWTGQGYNGFADMGNTKYWFEFEVYEMTTIGLQGKLTVKVGEEVVHVSEVSGRGFLHKENYFYHLAFETPKQTDYDYEIDDYLLVLYNQETDQLYVLDSFNEEMYKFYLERQ